MKRVLLILAALVATWAAEAQTNPYPIVPIDTMQYVSPAKLALNPPNDSPDYVNPIKKNLTFGDTVRVDGYVIFNPKVYGLSSNRKSTFLSLDTIAKAWQGVEVMADGPALGTGVGGNVTTANLITESKFYDNMVYGTKVRVTARYSQFQGNTQLYVLRANPNWDNSVEILDLTPHKIVPKQVALTELQTGSTQAANKLQNKVEGEKYEGVYVEIPNVTVFTRTPFGGTRWNWSIADDNGNEIEIRDISAYYRNDDLEDTVPKVANTFVPPIIGSKLAYLRGIITESDVSAVRRFWIAPLSPSDVGPSTYTPPTLAAKTRIPTVATSSDSVFITAKVQQGSTTVSNVKLFYTQSYASTTFDSIVMLRNVLPNDTMTWYAKLPQFANNTVVKYFIRMRDANGIVNNAPDTFGSNSAFLVLDGGVKTIQQLQFSPYKSNATIWHNDSLNGIDVRGIVTGTNLVDASNNILTIQNGTGLNSAIIINRRTGGPTSTWKVGDSVKVTACRVLESYNMTTLNNIEGSVISSGNALPAFITSLNIDTVAAISASSARRLELSPYEGMLVKFPNVYVVNVNADAPSGNFGEFVINNDSSKTTGLRVDDLAPSLRMINNMLPKKLFMDKAQGVLVLTFSNWKLEPRDSNDLDFTHMPDVVKPVITLLGKNPDSLLLNASYVEPGFNATDDVDGDLTSSVIISSNLDSSKVGAYLITYRVSDMAGNKDSANRVVIVYESTGIERNEMNFANVNVYPSPASDVLNVSVSGFKTLPVNIEIRDVVGRELYSKSINSTSVNEKININEFRGGVYFLNIKNVNGSKTVKFVVSNK